MKALVFAMLLIGGCSAVTVQAELPKDPDTVEVMARPATFHPEFVQIPVGKTVVWRNVANIPHTITPDEPSKAGAWKAGKVEVAGDYFTHKFETPGRFTYNCAIHAGMIGTIDVK